MHWVIGFCYWLVQVVLRSQTKCFVLLKKPWLIERTADWARERAFGRLMHCRRLVRDYELLLEASETFIYLAMIRMMVGHFA
jgi:transposase